MSLGRATLMHDLSADPHRDQPAVRLLRVGPAMFVPLGSRGGPFGTLMIANSKGGRHFDDEDLRLVEVFAEQAAVGLEYARARQEVDRLLVMADRERIAKELHDGAIQSLFAVGMGLQGAATIAGDEQLRERLETAVGEIDRVIRDLRNYIFGLRPGILADRQLDQALRTLVAEFHERTGIVTVVEVDAVAAAELASKAGDIVQLCREALSNVARHSGADTCRVSLGRRGDGLVLEIDDDGKGFDPTAVVARSGLANLQSRAESLGGSFALESEQATGTLVRITLPG
jgi:signal transduction histidine kinase